MHLAHIKLRDFRNYARLEADFAPGFHLFLGQNAQGKTNLLEAIYLLATLRSFRGVGSAQMVRYGAKGYFVGGTVVGEGSHEMKLYWSASRRNLTLDNRDIHKLSEYFGVLRSVVFCTEDMHIVKGASRMRRRFLDLLLSQTYPAYLPAWLRYTQALRARNALLKRQTSDAAALDGFTRELVRWGTPLVQYRREFVPRFAPLAQQAYRHISHLAEDLALEYQPSVKADFAVELAQSSARARVYHCTLIGPHRDDLSLLLDQRSAAQFGSEGQKRTLVIALKMAQAL